MDYSEQLEKILSDYKIRLGELNNSNSYENFSDKMKSELQGKDKLQAKNLFLEKLKNYSSKMKTKIEEVTAEENKILNPNQDPSFLAVEFGNAIALSQLKPQSLSEILKESVREGRIYFASKVLEFIKRGDGPEGYRREASEIKDEIFDSVGLNSLRDSKFNFEYLKQSADIYSDEVLSQIAGESFEALETQAHNRIAILNVQLWKESIK